MTDFWADVRERANELPPGGGDFYETPCRKDVLNMLSDADALLAVVESLLAFDVREAESWARSVAEQWNHSDAETRKTMFGGMKIAEKLLVILPDLKEALAALPEHLK